MPGGPVGDAQRKEYHRLYWEICQRLAEMDRRYGPPAFGNPLDSTRLPPNWQAALEHWEELFRRLDPEGSGLVPRLAHADARAVVQAELVRQKGDGTAPPGWAEAVEWLVTGNAAMRERALSVARGRRQAALERREQFAAKVLDWQAKRLPPEPSPWAGRGALALCVVGGIVGLLSAHWFAEVSVESGVSVLALGASLVGLGFWLYLPTLRHDRARERRREAALDLGTADDEVRRTDLRSLLADLIVPIPVQTHIRPVAPPPIAQPSGADQIHIGCGTCKTTGTILELVPCTACDRTGTQYVIDLVPGADNGIYRSVSPSEALHRKVVGSEKCEVCKGTGKSTLSRPCDQCGTRGYRTLSQWVSDYNAICSRVRENIAPALEGVQRVNAQLEQVNLRIPAWNDLVGR